MLIDKQGKDMVQLTYNAKIAVIKVLNEILNADNVVHENEVYYMNEVIKDFGLDAKYEEDVNALMTLQALVVIDNDINYNEVKLYNAFCESCNIEKDFNVDEYDGVTLSGPFVNPEDLMNI